MRTIPGIEYRYHGGSPKVPLQVVLKMPAGPAIIVHPIALIRSGMKIGKINTISNNRVRGTLVRVRMKAVKVPSSRDSTTDGPA